MYIFLLRFAILSRVFFRSPFTNQLSFRCINQMSRGPDLISESRHPKAFHCFVSLLQGEPISLRSSIETLITLIESKRNATMKTSYSESDSTYSSTNYSDMWIICVDGRGMVSSDESRTSAIITYTEMSFWSNWQEPCISRLFVFH